MAQRPYLARSSSYGIITRAKVELLAIKMI